MSETKGPYDSFPSIVLEPGEYCAYPSSGKVLGTRLSKKEPYKFESRWTTSKHVLNDETGELVPQERQAWKVNSFKSGALTWIENDSDTQVTLYIIEDEPKPVQKTFAEEHEEWKQAWGVDK